MAEYEKSKGGSTKAPSDLGIGHGVDGSIPEEAAGDTEIRPATGGKNRTEIMGRNSKD